MVKVISLGKMQQRFGDGQLQLKLKDELKHLSRGLWLQKRCLFLWHCSSHELIQILKLIRSTIACTYKYMLITL